MNYPRSWSRDHRASPLSLLPTMYLTDILHCGDREGGWHSLEFNAECCSQGGQELPGRRGSPLTPCFSVSGPCSWALNVLPGCIAGKAFSPRGFPVGPELVTETCHHSGWWGGDPRWVMPYPLHPPLLGVRRGGHSLVLSRGWVWDPTRPYPGSWKPGRHESVASRGPLRRVRWGLRETLPCACCAQILWGHCSFRLSTSPDLHLFWQGTWLLARQGLPSSEHGVTSTQPSGSWALSGNHVNIERLSIAPSCSLQSGLRTMCLPFSILHFWQVSFLLWGDTSMESMQVNKVTQVPVEWMGPSRTWEVRRVSPEWAMPQSTFNWSFDLITNLKLVTEFVFRAWH